MIWIWAMCQAMGVAGDCGKVGATTQLAFQLENLVVFISSGNPRRQVIRRDPNAALGSYRK
jgi:hypothetical protein